MMQKFERKVTFTPDEIIPLISGERKAANRHDFGPGVGSAHVSGLRLATFSQKGIKCVTCGVTGVFFALERGLTAALKDPRLPYHLNLYALDQGGEEVLMTHDHILSRANGGADNLTNAQPMCSPCNSEKGRIENAHS